MKPAPETLGGAATICYAVIGSKQNPTGNCRHIVAGEIQGAFAGLAICQYEGQDAFYLFYCDADWNVIADGWWQSIEEAKRQAEFEYEGISSAWRTQGAI